MNSFLEYAVDNCVEKGMHFECEGKDCWECDVAHEYGEVLEDEMIRKHMEAWEEQHKNDPEYQKYLSIPTDCLWGCTHCAFKGTDECVYEEDVNNESDGKTEKNS